MSENNQEIKTLEEVEQVRLRPGVFIPNINYFIYELVDNSTDEFLSGYGKKITVSINKNKVVTVTDKGRGLPVKPSETYPDKSQAEVAFSSIRSGSKFGTDGTKSAGMNGVGSSGINFLSEYFNVEIRRNGKIYDMRFEKGKCIEKLHETGATTKTDTGTKIVTKPDETIWNKFDDFDIPAIKKRMKQLAYLNPGLTIELKIDYLDADIDDVYCYENGLDEYIKELLGSEEPLTSIYRIDKSVPIDDNGNTLDLDIAFAYTEKYYDTVIAFTNNVANTNKRSSHIVGFKTGIASAIKETIIDSELNKSKLEITNEDTREGIVSVISIKIFNPFFEGQGKDILNMPIVRSTISNAVEEFLLDQFDKNPNEKNIILSRVIDAARVREATRKTKEATRKVKGLSGGKVPGLTKAGSNDPSEREIFLVEG